MVQGAHPGGQLDVCQKDSVSDVRPYASGGAGDEKALNRDTHFDRCGIRSATQLSREEHVDPARNR